MAKNMKGDSLPAVVLKGTTVCLISLLLGLMILAKAIDKEWISEKNAGYGIMLLLIISSNIGSAVAKASKVQHKLVLCGSTAFAYYISLLSITLVFFHGKYSGIGETALMILCGSTLPLLTKDRGHGAKRKGNTKAYNW